MLSNEKIAKWIEDIVSFGNRRPGTKADAKTEDYIVKKLEDFGVPEIEKQPYEISKWEADDWELVVEEERISCFYTPNTAFTNESGVDNEIVYVEDGTQEDFENNDVQDKIILFNTHFPTLEGGPLKSLAEYVFDPEDALEDFAHPATWIYPNWWEAYRLACEYGAKAIIGILADYPTNENRIYIPYFGPLDGGVPDRLRSEVGLSGEISGWIPGLWVGREDGEKLIETIEETRNNAKANLTLTGDVEQTKTHNIVGRLPGQKKDSITIHSHHDAPWSGAVEDGSGIAESLALAENLAGTSKQDREKTYVFLFTGTHFGGPARGDMTFIRNNPEIMSKLVLEVCIEHIAKDFSVKDNEWFDTGNPEFRSVFTHGGTEKATDLLVNNLAKEVEKQNLQRLAILPANTPLGVPTDANAFYKKGHPVYSYISGPEYLFDPCDTMDKVAIEQLNPVATAFAETLKKIDKTPPRKILGNK